MKELAGAKMRLADVLDRKRARRAGARDAHRRGQRLHRERLLRRGRVISGDSEVHWHARELGAKPLAEPKTLSGLNEGLTFGQRYLGAAGCGERAGHPAGGRAVGDARRRARGCRCARRRAGERVAMVRAGDNGTNALAMRPVEAIPMRFGRDSADAHRRRRAKAGVELSSNWIWSGSGSTSMRRRMWRRLRRWRWGRRRAAGSTPRAHAARASGRSNGRAGRDPHAPVAAPTRRAAGAARCDRRAAGAGTDSTGAASHAAMALRHRAAAIAGAARRGDGRRVARGPRARRASGGADREAAAEVGAADHVGAGAAAGVPHGRRAADWPDDRRARNEWAMAQQSIGAAMQNIMLAAHAMGLSSYWISAPLFAPEACAEALALAGGMGGAGVHRGGVCGGGCGAEGAGGRGPVGDGDRAVSWAVGAGALVSMKRCAVPPSGHDLLNYL